MFNARTHISTYLKYLNKIVHALVTHVISVGDHVFTSQNVPPRFMYFALIELSPNPIPCTVTSVPPCSDPEVGDLDQQVHIYVTNVT